MQFCNGFFIIFGFQNQHFKLFFMASGKWDCYAKITDQSGLVSIGEPFSFIVYNEGQ